MSNEFEAMLNNENGRETLHREVERFVLNALFGRVTDSFNVDNLAFLAAAIDSSQYAADHLSNAKRFAGAHDLITYGLSRRELDGLNLEFGVFSGSSINHMARSFRDQTFHGFDSFEGLPEDWRQGFARGAFATGGLPAVENNVNLIKGWFDHTIPGFLDSFKDIPVSFLHVDCDLYSSTKTIFHLLRDRIVPGTVIVFDEYFNYPSWRIHEYRAFKEFVDYYKRSYEYIGLVPHHQQVAVRIIR
ncbi:class I SAM-dependent methyltransferase [Methylobacterium sp. JK268]